MRGLITGVLIGFVALLCCSIALADGLFIPDAHFMQRTLINEPEQKAVVLFKSVTEDLIISPGFKGDASRFAWVIPVPARPEIKSVKGALFHELVKLTPTPRAPGMGGPGMRSATPPDQVTVLERKTVGAYDVSVLQSTDANALMKWLKANSYSLPDRAVEPMRYYIRKHWTFVACRVKVPSASRQLSEGTLAPIRMSFRTSAPVYPLRLSSANPDAFDLLVYVMFPKRQYPRKPFRAELKTAPDILLNMYQTLFLAEFTRNPKEYPTLSSLTRDDLRIYRLNARLSPKDCTTDLTWETP